MATKRRGAAKRAARGKRGGSRGAQAARRRRRPARKGARAGARATRREQVARQVERDVGPAVGEPAPHDPELEQAPQPAAAPWTGESEGVPGYARLVSQPKDTQAAARRQEAEAELGRRREEAEREAAPGSEPRTDVPALREIALELTIGAMRLARTVATAPLRIGLAFLRDG